MPTLELRRLFVDLIWCCKIMFGIVDMLVDEFFELSSCVQTRGHRYKLFKKINSVNARAYFFSERVVNVWNYLPVDVVDFRSMYSFKRTIKLVCFTDFLRC